ncbi:unnamed protein product [Closterium sp. NIES-53]
MLRWLMRDASARLAVRNHLPSTERAHFSQYKSARALYDAVVARYSSPTTAALSCLMLPYLFPDLAAFATVPDLVAHLRTSDARYRAALPTEDHFLSLCPTELTVDLLEERLAAAEKNILAVGASRGDRRTPFFEGGRRRTGKGKGSKGGGGGGGGSGGGGGGGGGGGPGVHWAWGSCLEDGLELSSLVTLTPPGSSCEAEIYAGAMAAQELRWLTYLLTDLGEAPHSPPLALSFLTVLSLWHISHGLDPVCSLPLLSPSALSICSLPLQSPSALSLRSAPSLPSALSLRSLPPLCFLSSSALSLRSALSLPSDPAFPSAPSHPTAHSFPSASSLSSPPSLLSAPSIPSSPSLPYAPSFPSPPTLLSASYAPSLPSAPSHPFAPYLPPALHLPSPLSLPYVLSPILSPSPMLRPPLLLPPSPLLCPSLLLSPALCSFSTNILS